MKTGKLHIGTSGWNYGDWKGFFYPEDIKTKDWLRFYADHFETVEINSSFYHLTRQQTALNWVSQVPESFRFCVKMNKYLTHIKRLKEPEETLENFFGTFQSIKEYLGPVLVQLPPSLKFEPDIAGTFFKALKKYDAYTFALEVRHSSWLDPAALEMIRQNEVSLVISQSGAGYPYTEEITAHDIYVRFHGPGALYKSSYTKIMLRSYAKKIKAWLSSGHDVWVFFNNTMSGVGLKNAEELKKMID